jgi:hypothetical protein
MERISTFALVVFTTAWSVVPALPADITPFSAPGQAKSWAFGINDQGTVVGAVGNGSLAAPDHFYGWDDPQQWTNNVTAVEYGKGHLTWLGPSGSKLSLLHLR